MKKQLWKGSKRPEESERSLTQTKEEEEGLRTLSLGGRDLSHRKRRKKTYVSSGRQAKRVEDWTESGQVN